MKLDSISSCCKEACSQPLCHSDHVNPWRCFRAAAGLQTSKGLYLPSCIFISILYVYLYIYIFLYIYIYICIWFRTTLPHKPGPLRIPGSHLSICLSVCRPVCTSIALSIYLSIILPGLYRSMCGAYYENLDGR